MDGYDFENAKKEYRELCRMEKSINVYMQDWFLDAAIWGGEEWRVVLVKERGEIAAAFPFGYRRRHGMNYIFAPWQCASMGIWVREREYRSNEEERTHKMNIVGQIVKLLPPYDSFKVPFGREMCDFADLLHGCFNFMAEPYYTMVIQNRDADDLIMNISKERRKRIRHAIRQGYHAEENKLSIEEYWDFLIKTYESKGKRLHYEKKKFLKLINSLWEHNACVIRSIANDKNELAAACIILEDAGRCYHQFGTEMQGKDTDATSLAVYESIRYTLNKGKIFDFEGSMIKGVCEFNSSFNPEWEEYYIVSRYSRKYRFLKAWRDAFLKLSR